MGRSCPWHSAAHPPRDDTWDTETITSCTLHVWLCQWPCCLLLPPWNKRASHKIMYQATPCLSVSGSRMRGLGTGPWLHPRGSRFYTGTGAGGWRAGLTLSAGSRRLRLDGGSGSRIGDAPVSGVRAPGAQVRQATFIGCHCWGPDLWGGGVPRPYAPASGKSATRWALAFTPSHLTGAPLLLWGFPSWTRPVRVPEGPLDQGQLHLQ